MTSVTIRMEEEAKREATRIAKENGIDLPTAFRMFLAQIIKTSSIPLNLAATEPVAMEPFRDEAEVMEFLGSYADEVLYETR
ncbi:MAG: type II toxin-antitoxin system RelB/DinJ family antitoxin [Coriobacteriia bacterium]|nr:type II toxin-antitoxin system RelB/DinJ family antitoxin [Coriobacteriia bacterium]